MASDSTLFPENTPARVQVLLPVQRLSLLDYSVPADMDLKPGDIVRAPLGPRKLVGVVWDDPSGGKPAPIEKLKPVIERIDLPGFNAPLLKFLKWVSGYYLAGINGVLRMAMNVPAAFEPLPHKTLVEKSGAQPSRMTPARLKVLDCLAPGEALAAPELAARAGVSDAVVRGLVKSGVLRARLVAADAPYMPPDPDLEGPALSADQQAAAAQLMAAVRAKKFEALLLEGVTGAGKTEVYFEAVAEALRDPEGQVLVLVPEIALTSQWLERFIARFGAAPVEWHSDLGVAERRRAWRAINEGEARVVVGARSALFLPFRDLRLIVVDEEHDPSFKQEEGICYNARDMAVVRAHLSAIPVVLASATPSLETLQNAKAGRYAHLKLKSRFGGAALPDVEAIDMRQAGLKSTEWLSPALVKAIEARLARGEQSLLFLNRRGYAPLTLCRKCGERIECPQCAAWLVEHRFEKRLVCHHCGFARPVPRNCPSCEAEDSLVACGPGIERLAEEVAARFPTARLIEVTSDTVTSPKRAAAAVAAIDRGEVDIILGTQLVTKGYHFPKLTLVGVIDADIGLAGGDLRAAERSFQQLTQVAGRAGREDRPGQVLIQTHMPENPVMAALIAGRQAEFMAREAEARRLHAMPPFGRLAALIVSGKDEGAVIRMARDLARQAPHQPGLRVLGPAPAPLSLLRGRYRYRLLMKADKDVAVQRALKDWLKKVPQNKAVRLAIDIDPYSFL